MKVLLQTKAAEIVRVTAKAEQRSLASAANRLIERASEDSRALKSSLTKALSKK